MTDIATNISPQDLLRHLNITKPIQIEMETIAQFCGATIVYQPLEGCEARLIGYHDRAFITVNSSARKERQRFSAAHELAHWIGHRGKVALQCDGQQFTQRWNGKDKEAWANNYAAQLLLPTSMFQPFTANRPLTFDTARRVASHFQTSLTASAIRLVELSPVSSMVICSSKNRRVWFRRSPIIEDADIWPRKTLQPATSAYRLLHCGEEPAGPIELCANAWFGGPQCVKETVTEDSTYVTADLVLTLLTWQAAS